MRRSGEPERQRRFYETRAHAHLQPRADDLYAEKLAGEVASSLGLGPGDRVLEIGAGFGRFTFALLGHCGSVVAADLAPSALETLERARSERGIPPERCITRCVDVSQLEPDGLGERFRFIVGFFILHHLPDVRAAVRRLASVLEPGGAMAFVEPNRRNPLFVAQMMCCPDMRWSEEIGMLRLSHRKAEEAFRAAALTPAPARRFGFFPPQLFNRIGALRRFESRLEASSALRPVLPFLLLSARAPEGVQEPPSGRPSARLAPASSRSSEPA
jgi:SAM-dependent methyltransferase